ncbi:uncharacterized protein LOC144629832 [Oculina patagonica]
MKNMLCTQEWILKDLVIQTMSNAINLSGGVILFYFTAQCCSLRIFHLTSVLATDCFAMYHNVTNSSTKPPLIRNSAFYASTLSSSVLYAIFSPVTVIGNALVCAAIWRNPSLRTPSYILLAGLAFTDFCTGLIVLPSFVANGLIYLTDHRKNSAGKNSRPTASFITTAIGNSFSSYFFLVTILVMTLMSIERWLHMSRRSLVTVRRACYAVAVLLLIPIPLVVFYVKDVTSFLVRVAIISTVLFCLTLTSVAYFKVFRIIRRHQQQIHANELPQNFAQPAINFQKYKKSVFTILYILAVFYISYLPTVVSIVLVLVLSLNEFTYLLVTASTILVYLSPFLNPLLYLWRMNDIRTEVSNLVKKRFCHHN